MSQFARSQSRQSSNGRHIAVRLAGNTNGQPCPTRRPQRPNNRRYRPSNHNLGAFLKAPTKVSNRDSEDFVSVKTTRKPRRHRAQSPLVPKMKANDTNSFAALGRDDDASPTKHIALPKVVKPKAPTGAWGARSFSSIAKVVADKPMKARVSFANDSDTLMKPSAAETREYEKGSVPTEFVEYPKEDEYLKLKRNKSAWRPKSIAKAHLEVKATEAGAERADREYTMRLELNARAYEVFNQEPVPSYLGSWADACDSDSEDEEEVVLTTDSLGRPMTDNSAW